MDTPFPLPLKQPKEVPLLHASKWIKHPVLLSVSEMQRLLKDLSPVHIALVREPVEEKEMIVSHESFLAVYARYLDALRSGHSLEDLEFRKYFSSIWTSSLTPLYAMMAGNKFLVKSQEPVMQLQPHYFFYSQLDHQMHSMVKSQESISWGIQFAYPQLFEDPKTHEIHGVRECGNAPLFLQLARWMRSHTLPTPFIVQGKLSRSFIRVGKEMLSWIGVHPGLKAQGIGVYAD